jgi:hypothetical protein
MIDWFVILTPILILPIALLFFFLGCGSGEITNVSWVEGTFVITFYLAAQRAVLLGDEEGDEHEFEFTIYDSSPDDEVASATDNINSFEVIAEGKDGKATRVGYQFSHYFQPGDATLFCRVIDLSDQMTLVANGDDCRDDFELHEHYLIVFDADVSEDGTVPNTEFDFCTHDLV